MAVGALAVWRAGPTNSLRYEYNLALPPLPSTIRPSMLLTPILALGRAPLVDYLWIRATKLKEEGHFFDAYQLSEMICELQPKFAPVWAFQGWNMAYNISVTLKSPEERWRWVRNGYELIRDRGIPLNPTNTQLYRELAWILFHKVGDTMDEWHSYYKLQFALIVEDILGQPPDDYVRPGRVRGDFYRDYDFQSLADAPQNFDTLLKERPDVAVFIETLKGFEFDSSVSGVYLGLLKGLRDGTLQIPNTPEGMKETRLAALRKLMEDPKTESARKAVENFWRAHRLRSELKLDPARIVELQKGLGVTLDFRLAQTHALYWANMGIEKGLETHSLVDIHRLNTTRIEFFCLQKMFYGGRMAMSRQADLGEPPNFGPDIRMAPVLFEAYQRDSKEYLREENQGTPISINFMTGFVGFARNAILRYSELGMDDKGREMFDFLRKYYDDPMYAGGYNKFLEKQFIEDKKNLDLVKATARIENLILGGLKQYAYDEDEEAVRYFNRAKQVYDVYRRDLTSKRLDIPRKFPEIIKDVAERIGPQMYPGTYNIIRRKLGMPPIEDLAATSRPASR
ncbi:MAG: hypothetical protein HS101_08515 [Planctomycetia bacterium]|nr:hypothetical protein [Planctomycetia bacterium]MCC7315301.1 hypothetical protein [Planctomycetota bacterium]